MSMTAEIVVMWMAVTGYAVAAVLFIVGLAFNLPKAVTAGLLTSTLAAVVHAVAIAGRWVRIGHGPYLGFYEVVSSFAFVTVLVVALLVWRHRGLAPLGAIALPVSFLAIGAAMFAPKAELEITSRLASWWLAIHVTFAKLSYGAFIGAFALAVIFLVRERARGSIGDMLAKLPRQTVLDDLCFRFVAVGFIFLGIMIGAGAIWANEAWGRYWAWDPIETWSLIAWLLYAAVLHARLTLSWRGRRFALIAAGALPFVLFALVGVPLVYQSIHGAYLQGY